ncbi:hypothetical protein DFH06DRAFT_1144994 [Mycena polygramma]|nr:hypothetical protein DFH06DRAFT_1144994 [Mycena polygramma]
MACLAWLGFRNLKPEARARSSLRDGLAWLDKTMACFGYVLNAEIEFGSNIPDIALSWMAHSGVFVTGDSRASHFSVRADPGQRAGSRASAAFRDSEQGVAKSSPQRADSKDVD